MELADQNKAEAEANTNNTIHINSNNLVAHDVNHGGGEKKKTMIRLIILLETQPF